MRVGWVRPIFFDKGKGKGHEEVTGIRISTGFACFRRFAHGGEGGHVCRLSRCHQFRQRARAAVAEPWKTQSQSVGQQALESRRSRHHADTPRARGLASLPRDLSGPYLAERQDPYHSHKSRQSPLRTGQIIVKGRRIPRGCAGFSFNK